MLNRVVLVGRLTKEPDFKITPSGVAVCKFILAVNRPFSNNQGEKETDFVSIIVWRKQAENVNQYCNKGSLVGVDGRIQTGSYEGQDGKRVYTTDVVAESVTFLDSKPQTNMTEEQQINHNRQQINRANETYRDDPFANMGGKINITEDDLPF